MPKSSMHTKTHRCTFELSMHRSSFEKIFLLLMLFLFLRDVLVSTHVSIFDTLTHCPVAELDPSVTAKGVKRLLCQVFSKHEPILNLSHQQYVIAAAWHFKPDGPSLTCTAHLFNMTLNMTHSSWTTPPGKGCVWRACTRCECYLLLQV